MSSLSKTTFPLEIGTSPRIARPIVVLPDPDSPTKPTVSRDATEKETPSTARTAGRRDPRVNTTLRSVISSSERLPFPPMKPVSADTRDLCT